MTEVRNLMRGAKDPWILETEVMPLPGDQAVPSTAPETPEDIDALWAELDARDAALLKS